MKDIKGKVNISGFPGPYEASCQIMLQKGYEWIVKQKDVDLKATTYQNIYGLLTPDSDDAEQLSEVITNDIPGGVTGAMHQAVMSHLIYIANHGVDEWIESVHKERANWDSFFLKLMCATGLVFVVSILIMHLLGI